ncbi:MAG: hypothetical protein PHT51_04970, partial [Patescibacteria group bacterium]|nr:hypothetical protein [Patescibacteria group bacterium]
MRRNKKVFLYFLLFFALFSVFLVIGSKTASASQVNSPIIIEARSGVASLDFGKAFISGTTDINTEILIYIDGSYSGNALLADLGNGLVGFSFTTNDVLVSGSHEAMVLARDKTSLVLSQSARANFSVKPIPAPTLLSPDASALLGVLRPIISGLALSGTKVKIYLDDVLVKQTEILIHDSGTANFAYQPEKDLTKGEHFIYLIAESENGSKSEKSELVKIFIEDPMPAPTLLKQVVNKNSTVSQPFVVGLAKNNSLVKVYIDKKYDGEFQVVNH